jgi:hypothetical protein
MTQETTQIVIKLVLHNLKRKQANKQPLTKLEKQILKGATL